VSYVTTFDVVAVSIFTPLDPLTILEIYWINLTIVGFLHRVSFAPWAICAVQHATCHRWWSKHSLEESFSTRFLRTSHHHRPVWISPACCWADSSRWLLALSHPNP